MREFTADNLQKPQVFEMAGEPNRGIRSIHQKVECGQINGKTGVFSKIEIETSIDAISVTVPLPGSWKKASTDIYAFEPSKGKKCKEIIITIKRDEI